MFCAVPVEPLQQLEEFSSFISCIKCFGRSIIPPLVTQNQRTDFQKIREAAALKEAEIVRRKLSQKSNAVYASTGCDNSDFDTCNQETCALWCPSSKEHVSVAISKFPTSTIYSSVHTDAIVCADLIEKSRQHPRRNEIDCSENVSKDCVKCSHSKMDFDCHFCQAEYDENFHSCGFVSEVSPEVPCRSDSLMNSSPSFFGDDQISVAETDCESLPTVICSHKPDTDTESSATCLTQSTDLDKYMVVSCDFSSPDNSAAQWDSQSTSQQFTMSRSDDASSGTIVNTENELTPCASTLAEFTDNIEDEFSSAEDPARDANPVRLKRAHSIDSYMKIIQSCARNMQVKKSSSEPLNTKSKLTSNSNDNIKASATSKTSQLIKEDSKESEESKDLPEKDAGPNEVREPVSSPSKDVLVSDAGDMNVTQKRHVRKNSYTLDHPSPVLIEAHADCSCCFDSDSLLPPHCSALQDKSLSNSAFIREKVKLNVPGSMQNFPILNVTNVAADMIKEKSTSCVVDVLPEFVEDGCDKSYSENSNEEKVEIATDNRSSYKICDVLENQEKVEPDNKLHAAVSSFEDTKEEYFTNIYKEIHERYAAQVNELYEEQRKQWKKLREDQENFFYESFKQSILVSQGKSSFHEDPGSSERDSFPEKEVTFNNFSNSKNGSFVAGNQPYPTFEDLALESFLTQNQNLRVPSQNSCPPSRLSKSYDQSVDSRASLTPSKEQKTPQVDPSLLQKSPSSSKFNQKSCQMNESFDNVASVAQFPYQSAVLLPQCDSQNFSAPSNVDLGSPCCCKQFPPHCCCFESFNSCEENASKPSNRDVDKKHTSHPDLHTLSSHCENDTHTYSELHSNKDSSCLRIDDDTDIKQIESSKIFRETKSSSDVAQLPKSARHQNTRSTSLLSMKDKTDVPVEDIISLCVKSIKNGSVPSMNIYTNKKMGIDPSVLKRFEKLPAFVKGFLTRRLFKTERVQSLIKTLQDTAVLIRKLSEDLSLKGDAVSERDVDFHRQLIVQLMSTFHNVYDIFCTISTKDRMSIISESRNLRLKKKKMEQKQDSVSVSQASVSDVPKKYKSSSATAKTIERKKRSAINTRTYTLDELKNFRTRSAIETRTYTIEDLKSQIGRPRSQTSPKSHPASPSSIYKTSVGLAHKRKTVSCKTSNSRRTVQLNWVP